MFGGPSCGHYRLPAHIETVPLGLFRRAVRPFAVMLPQTGCGIIGVWMFCAAAGWPSRMNLSSIRVLLLTWSRCSSIDAGCFA
jgi:hypothetical protein